MRASIAVLRQVAKALGEGDALHQRIWERLRSPADCVLPNDRQGWVSEGMGPGIEEVDGCTREEADHSALSLNDAFSAARKNRDRQPVGPSECPTKMAVLGAQPVAEH